MLEVLEYFAATRDPATVAEVSRQLAFPQSSTCLLYTSDAADERSSVDLGGRRIIKKKNKEDQAVIRLDHITMNHQELTKEYNIREREQS